jgi:hypothetical protein
MYMIDNNLQLIAIYLYICDLHDEILQFSCERFSNNKNPDFTDQEVITIYLYTMRFENLFKIKHIYKFTNKYLRSWFPLLPSYKNFNTRLNRLPEAFRFICNHLLSQKRPFDCLPDVNILDSLPIITCSGKRKAKVALELTDKGFCSTKGMYYYGLKLHGLALRRPNKLPFPESIVITPASENDLNVFKQYWNSFYRRHFFGDKIYHDSEFFQAMEIENGSLMFTPVKLVKNQPDILKQRDKAANDFFSTAVSKIRQPIESLFNWLIEITDIQRASRVRSSKGLLVHVFGKIAAAFIIYIF